jgi:hypothetical protein
MHTDEIGAALAARGNAADHGAISWMVHRSYLRASAFICG